MKKLLLASIASLCFGTAANAAITLSAGSGPNFNAFDNNSPVGSTSGATATLYGVVNWSASGLENGSLTNIYLQPAGDNSNYIYGGGSATVANFSPSLNSIDIYWGSIDFYNTLTLSNGDSITGAALGSQLGLSFDSNGNSGVTMWVHIFDETPFSGFTASSSQAAFEFDMAGPTVVQTGGAPEASTWVMMALGFGGLEDFGGLFVCAREKPGLLAAHVMVARQHVAADGGERRADVRAPVHVVDRRC